MSLDAIGIPLSTCGFAEFQAKTAAHFLPFSYKVAPHAQR
jgi:hypothetical protein